MVAMFSSIECAVSPNLSISLSRSSGSEKAASAWSTKLLIFNKKFSKDCAGGGSKLTVPWNGRGSLFFVSNANEVRADFFFFFPFTS